MNKQLIKFIELCLVDGAISNKEREVIFRKAKSLGVDEDECKILIDSYTHLENKSPDNNKFVTSKSKRNFTPKTVEKIKPADLNQEIKLLEKVAEINEKEEKISANYDLLLDDLKVKTMEVNKIKTESEVDFENFKKDYNKDKTALNDKYINTINQEVSKGFGKTQMELTSSQKTSLNNLKLRKRKAFILENCKWNVLTLRTKRRRIRNLFYFLGVGVLPFAAICYNFTYWSIFQQFWLWLLLAIFLFAFGKSYNNIIKENKMNFGDDDLKPIIDRVDKSFKIAFEQLELREKKINNYTSLLKYDLSIPKNKKLN